MGSTPSTAAATSTVGGSSGRVPQNNNISISSSSPKGGGLVGARIRSHKEASSHIHTTSITTNQPRPRPPTIITNTTEAQSRPRSPKMTKSEYENTTTATVGSGTPPSTSSRPPSVSVDEAAMSFNGSLPSGIHSSPFSCPQSVSSSATAGNAHILLPVPRPLDKGSKVSPHQHHWMSSTPTTTPSTTSTSKGGLSSSTSSKRSPQTKMHPSPVKGNSSTSTGQSCSSSNTYNISQSESGGACAGQSASLTQYVSLIPSLVGGGGMGDSRGDSRPPTVNEDDGMLSSLIQIGPNDNDVEEDCEDSNIDGGGGGSSKGGSILRTSIHSISSPHAISKGQQPITTASSSLQQQQQPSGRRESVDQPGSPFASISASLTPFPAVSSAGDANSSYQQQHRNSRSGRRSSQVAFVAFTEGQPVVAREPSAPLFKVRRRSTSLSQDLVPESNVAVVRSQRSSGDNTASGGGSSKIGAVSSSEMGGSHSAHSVVAPRPRRKSSCKFIMGSASDLGAAVMSEGDDCSSSTSSSVDLQPPSRTHQPSRHTKGGRSDAPPPPSKYSNDVLLRNASSTWDFDMEGLDARANVAEVPRSFFPALAASTYSPPVDGSPVTTASIMTPIELLGAPTMRPHHTTKHHQQHTSSPAPIPTLSSVEQGPGSPLLPNNQPNSMLALNGTCNPTPGHYFSNSMHTPWSPPMLNISTTPLKTVAASTPELHPPAYDNNGSFHRIGNSASPEATLNASTSLSSRGPSSSRPVPRIQLLASRHKRSNRERSGGTSNNASISSYPLRSNNSTSSMMLTARDFVSVLPQAISNDATQQQLPLPAVSSPLSSPEDYALDISSQ